MHESGTQIMFILVGFVVLSVLLIGLQKAGIFHGVSGSYFFDFVRSLQDANQTY